MAAWQLTKNNSLELNVEEEEYDLSSFPYSDKSITVSSSEIEANCGKKLESYWYETGGDENSYKIVKKSDGTIDTEQGYKKKNDEGYDAENYPNCESDFIFKAQRVN